MATTVLENLAARAAEHVVQADFAQANRSKLRLLRDIEATDTSDENVRKQLARRAPVSRASGVSALPCRSFFATTRSPAGPV